MGSGENGFLFSGSWGALVIIFRDLGSKLIVLGIKGALQKSKKNLTLKEKPSSRMIFFQKKSSADPLGYLNVFTSLLTLVIHLRFIHVVKFKCIYFPANMLIWIVLMTNMANYFYYRGKFVLRLLILRLIIKYLEITQNALYCTVLIKKILHP